MQAVISEVMTFGEKIKALMKERKLSQRAFATAADISTNTLWRVFSMESIDECNPTTFQGIAAALGISPDELTWKLRGDSPSLFDSPPPARPPLPVPGRFTIPRVSGVAATDFREYPVDLMNREGVPGQLYPYPSHDPMVLRVAGASMTWDHPDSIYDGDDIIFGNALEEELAENSIVVARHLIQETQTVKRLHYIDGETIELRPQNPTYPSLRVRRDEVLLREVKVIVGYKYKRK
jgi:SOS-response transcriptional repressor LexA